jgi:hypothetical protein
VLNFPVLPDIWRMRRPSLACNILLRGSGCSISLKPAKAHSLPALGELARSVLSRDFNSDRYHSKRRVNGFARENLRQKVEAPAHLFAIGQELFDQRSPDRDQRRTLLVRSQLSDLYGICTLGGRATPARTSTAHGAPGARP